MATDFLQETTTALAGLMQRHGYVVAEHERSPSFGNALVVLESDQLHLRATRDRGVVSVQISGPADDEWFSIQTVARLLSPDGGMVDVTDMPGASAFITQHHDRLTELFREEEHEETHRKLKEVELASLRERFGHPG